jgi:hypothetical protein
MSSISEALIGVISNFRIVKYTKICNIKSSV